MADTPETRKERALAGISDAPMTRFEQIVAGKQITPVTREERFLKDFIDNGGSEPTGTITITENGQTNVAQYEFADVQVPQPSGKINITQNATDLDIAQYATANVQVPQGVFPTGAKTITENGSYDVTRYALADINVTAEGITIMGTQQQSTDRVIVGENSITLSTDALSYFLGDSTYIIAEAIDQVDITVNHNTMFLFGGLIGTSLFGVQMRYTNLTLAATGIGTAAASRLQQGISWRVYRFK